MSILWTIIIGFIAGVIAKFLMPGKNEPSGFILTTILGIVGAFVASFLGQTLGFYAPGEGAGFIGAIIGAVVVLFVWGIISFHNLPIEAYPDVANNYVQVITQWPGHAAEEVEKLITVLELLAVNGVGETKLAKYGPGVLAAVAG